MPCTCKLAWGAISKYEAEIFVKLKNDYHKVPVFAEEIKKNNKIMYRVIGVDKSTDKCPVHRLLLFGLRDSVMIYKKGFD
ncbi:hypothetical protein [Fictibacillus sp. NRS-1165]|uniref:hypothetical protein n=1 Tax=Fictibacillus sp. NRS-1165 TaxID=3144463 RepID=UPI003D234C8D